MPHRVVMLCYEGAQILDIAGPLEVFARTSRWLEEHHGSEPAPYEIVVVASREGALRLSNGLSIFVHALADAGRPDTLLVTGGIGFEQAARDPELCEWLRTVSPSASRVAGVCTGSIVLAAAGLLTNHRATTHWAYLKRLQEAEPNCEVDQSSIFVKSGKLITSAGVTAGMDMALALVEDDHGKSVALHVAQELVMFLRRPGDQAQFSRHVQAELRDTPFSALERWVLEHLDADLSVRALAHHAGLSERHFIRRFSCEIGCAPAAWVRTLRLAEARRQLEHGSPSLKDVSRRCGFGDEQSMRRAFQAQLGTTPSEYAARFS